MRVLDDFRDLSAWHISASDEVKASLRRAPGSKGEALCLDFDFGSVSGYAVARRELPLEFPQDFELSFGLRGEAAANTLQLKLVDASGENVWWINRPDYAFPNAWQHVRYKRRHVEFAWGPIKDRTLRHSAAIELVVARGEGGGSGSVCFEQLALRELVAPAVTPPSPEVRATSTLIGYEPAHVLDSSANSAWRSDAATGAEQTLALDFGVSRELGGLVLHWLPGAHASRYDIDFSDDGTEWRTVRRVVDGNGGVDFHWLPESETRHLRLRLQGGPEQAYGLAEVEVKDLAWGATSNAFFEGVARVAPRGHFPRGFSGEQSYWTVVGIDGGTAHGLLSEDGALEIAPRSGSVEPFLLTEAGLVTWADVAVEQSLLDGYLPIPTVTWQKPDVTLKVTAFARGERERAELVATYSVENRLAQTRAITLALAVRPFQVNPPTQFLNTPGGVAPIRKIAWDGRALAINGKRQLFPLAEPQEVIVASFDGGSVAELLANPRSAPVRAVTDANGFASGVLLYRLEVPPHARREVGIVAPLTGSASIPAQNAGAWVAQQKAESADAWRRKLNRVELRLPGTGRQIADTVRTALAHILISRNGPALQPGTRAYARSWVRDGAMMSIALLRLGHAEVVRDYIDWYAPRQFTSGKVPCCVDRRGSDPVAENDSQGEWIHLIATYYRYTNDRAWLESMWPRVAAAVAYMEALRAQERHAGNQTEARRAFYGLMPPSISHEGYSDRPAYSYWDDFWALAGYDDAVEIARALGHDDEAQRIARSRDEFRRDLESSLRASVAAHGVDYLPGSADRGDFDATSTTIALSVAGLQETLPQPQLDRTFERYWQAFLKRRDGPPDWNDYTPYELRNVGAFVRLGCRDRAVELLDALLSDRRPRGWNQWAEVVGREARQPRFIGDMPHGWIASDFITAALDLLAFERPADQSLVLAAGVPVQWLSEEGIAIGNLRTPNGKLSYALRRDGKRVALDIAAGLTPPRGGLVFPWPYENEPGPAWIGNNPLPWNNRELRFLTLPAAVVIEGHAISR